MRNVGVVLLKQAASIVVGTLFYGVFTFLYSLPIIGIPVVLGLTYSWAVWGLLFVCVVLGLLTQEAVMRRWRWWRWLSETEGRGR